MNSIIDAKQSRRFDMLMARFLKRATDSATSDLLDEIITIGEDLVKSVRVSFMSDNTDITLTEEFDQDVVQQFFYKTIMGDYRVSPTRALRNIAYEMARSSVIETKNTYQDTLDAQVYEVNINSRLYVWDTLTAALKTLPMSLKSALLYLLYYPEDIERVRDIYSPLEYYVLLRHMRKFQTVIMDEIHIPNFKVPDTQIGRLLLTAALYKKSPLALVLLMQHKDLTSLIEFCNIFGGTKVHIPNTKELFSILEEASNATKMLENDTVSFEERQLLMSLAADLPAGQDYNPNMMISPVLSSFLEKNLEISLRNHQEAQEKLLRHANTAEELLVIWEKLNAEFATQVKLFTLIGGSITNIKDIEHIIKSLQNHVKEKTQEHIDEL